MAICRSICVIILLTFLINIVLGLYEDQVGKFDWKRSFVGKVKYASFDSKRLIVATEENVLASLSVKTGQILWRQLLEDPKEQQIQLLHVDKEIVTVSGALNSWFVRTWDTNSGTLLTEWTIYMEKIANSDWFIADNKLVHIIPTVGSHLEVTVYKLDSGENSGKTTKISTPWLTDINNCATAKPYYACISNVGGPHLYYVDVVSDFAKIFSKSVPTLLATENVGQVQIIEFSNEKPSLLLLVNNLAQIVTLNADSVHVEPYSVMPNAVSVKNADRDLVFQLEANSGNTNKLIKVVSKDLHSGSNELSVDIEYPLGLGAPYILAGQCKNSFCDLLLSSNDDALSLVRLPEGNILWTREEALSKIVATEFLELPVSDLDASIENEFKTTTNDIFSIFFNRLSTQAKQLSKLLLGGQFQANNVLVRDEFGLHKLIVVATKAGKLFAIDTLTGSIVWSYRLPNIEPFETANTEKMIMFVQRTARYAPLPAQCTLIAQDSSTRNGIIFQFDPISGLSSNGIEKLNYKVKQAMLLPYEDESNLKPVLVVSDKSDIFIYPSTSKEMVAQHSNDIYLYTMELRDNLLSGHSIQFANNNDLKTSLVWELRLGPSKLAAISMKPSSERVHSQGRVLPDRSVYYKYVNPNLIALATLTDDPVHKHVLSIYLIDGITGLVLYSTSHRRAKGPIHLVHSENWLVYSYFNERFRRTEVVAAELYEGQYQSNSTVFSSHSVSQLPYVQTQAYILPVTPVQAAVTLTERGITNKFLLVAMSNGGVTEIPWLLLQPRFSDIPCGPEESCIPYMPEVPMPPEAVINYNQSLARINGIQVAPARLESTSHILIHGLDLFYTRVAPSKTFDVLKEDFDHRLIVLVLTLLILASYVTKYFASQKALKQAWK